MSRIHEETSRFSSDRESPPVRVFSSPFRSAVKAKAPPECWISWVIFSRSLMDLSADCQRKWIVSLLSVSAFSPSLWQCLSPSSPLPPASSLQPFLRSYLSTHSIFVSLAARLLSWLFVFTPVSHLSRSLSSRWGLFLFTSFPLPAHRPILPSPLLSSAPVEPFVLPFSVT